MNLLRGMAVPFVVIGLASCSPSTGNDGGIDAISENPSGLGRVEIGTGQTDWEDLPATGARAELIYGAQGGYHIWGRARFRGFNPDISVSFRVTDVLTGRVLHSPIPARRWIENGVRRGLLDLGGGEFATDAELVILDILCSNEVLGRQLEMQVFVLERSSGATVSDTRIVTVVDETPSPGCAGGG